MDSHDCHDCGSPTAAVRTNGKGKEVHHRGRENLEELTKALVMAVNKATTAKRPVK